MSPNPQQDAEIAAFNELYADAYAAWLASFPKTPRLPWHAPDEAANDNDEEHVT